ncbi:hypothetical protein KTO58_19235 [Chitinophaga pendula]|uniref:hypothetical protein n=1 Tax=Chitinophaga TaxID=79328 RepID=UPI0012FE63C7|nr:MULTISPECIES: hypothetical protein [Chitinophaga]UCJ05810.1 hypothetical protein KTO58_19235 [Chitinophaga pendula]
MKKAKKGCQADQKSPTIGGRHPINILITTWIGESHLVGHVGMWIGSLNIDLSNLEGFEIFKAWENQNYLQRCHIVPKVFGGCNCEANLIMLC